MVSYSARSYLKNRQTFKPYYLKDSRYIAPGAVGTRVVTHTQKLRQAPKNTVIVSNRELCFPVVMQNASSAYSVVAFPVQPGLSAVFPLLSNTAHTFTRYEMRFSLDFVPMVGVQTPGNILIAMDRNMDESPPGSQQTLMSYAGAVAANIWSSCSFPTNTSMVKPSEKLLFTRYGSLQPGEDIKLYDMCNVFVALAGVDPDIEEGTVIGQVYINYECKFFDQRLRTQIDSNVFSFYTSPIDSTTPPAIPGDSQGNLQYVTGGGDVQYVSTFFNSDGSTDSSTGFTLVFPTEGYYMVVQDMFYRVTVSLPTPPYFIFPQPIGATSTPTPLMIARTGSAVDVSNPRNIVLNMANGAGAARGWCQCVQVLRVFESGTYLVGSENIVGGGFISKTVGNVVYTGGTENSTNESLIFAHQYSPNTVLYGDTYITAVQIDGQTATFFDPVTFPPSAGPLTATRSVAHHLSQAAFKGLRLARSRAHQRKKLNLKSELEDFEPEDDGPSLEELRRFYTKHFKTQ